MNRTDGMGRLHELRQKIDAEHRGRIEFVAKLRRTVASLRKRLIDENRAVHSAWFGPTRAELAEASRIKEAAAVAHTKELAEAARIKEEVAAARIKELAEAVRIKEAAAVARAEELAEAARIKEEEARTKELAAARIKELAEAVAKNALVKTTAKTVPVHASKKPVKKVRGY